MSEPCMCGDTACPICGVLQGTYPGDDDADEQRADEVYASAKDGDLVPWWRAQEEGEGQ